MANASAPSRWIVGRRADWPLIILQPLIALGLAGVLSRTPLTSTRIPFFGMSGTAADGFLGAFIMAHLIIVLFRSHGNPKIRVLHPFRFFWAPLILFLAMLGSTWIRCAVAVIAVFWDVYHSSLQTFGIGRIYDRKAGNDPTIGRALDAVLNHYIYIGPILGGALLTWHATAFYEFNEVKAIFFTDLPPKIIAAKATITRWVTWTGLPFLTFYLWSYWRLSRRGYRVSMQKAVLMAATAVTSIAAWGYNSFGMALFVMNFFHAFQYFVLIWTYERRNITQVFRVDGLKNRNAIGLLLLVGFGFLYGAVGGILEGRSDAILCATLTVSILHFWYEGFIWSVRSGQV